VRVVFIKYSPVSFLQHGECVCVCVCVYEYLRMHAQILKYLVIIQPIHFLSCKDLSLLNIRGDMLRASKSLAQCRVGSNNS
jgi:hypothetical protein